MPRVSREKSFPIGKLSMLVVIIVAITGIVAAIVWSKIRAQEAQQRETAVMQQAQLLDNAGSYAKERATLENYINSNPPKAYQYPSLIQLGALAYNTRDDTSALKWYKQAQAVSTQAQLVDILGLADSAAALGQKSAAIGYYRQALSIINSQKGSNAGEAASNVADYEQEIRLLGGKP